jgi:sterol desaturase/sphingolipid hydroxylase (fatty acid hydroxylase superfamily)
MDRTQALVQPETFVGKAWYYWLCTRPFWIYLPLVVLLLVWAAPKNPLASALGLVFSGLFAWTFVEWGLHALMHVRTRSKFFSRFQQFAHLGHHHEPDSLPRALITLRGSLPLAAMFFGLSLAMFRSFVPATLFFSGLLTGYIFYEFVHLATHARIRLPGLAWLERYHAKHHSRWNRSFGVTCPLWDYVFGTAPEQGRRSRE